MFLKHLSLQNFRSYSKSVFTFNEGTTIIIGPNTAGKSNLIEAIYFLATGKSFRADKDMEAISFGKDIGRSVGVVVNDGEVKLEVTLTNEPSKRYLVNGIARRRVDFAGNLPAVLFSPLDLELLVGSPGKRRGFLNDVLEQTDRDYRVAIIAYEKALRQRNALLEKAQEEGKRREEDFVYWDNVLIENGQTVSAKRKELIDYLNDAPKDIFPFTITYDKSEISKARLLQYKDAEIGAGVTLVGPHRDDFITETQNSNVKTQNQNSKLKSFNAKLFASRGQQRLIILQLKLLILDLIEKQLETRPILLLDDIFSELDEGHITHLLKYIGKQQTILTTTHEEFIPKSLLKGMSVVELKLATSL